MKIEKSTADIWDLLTVMILGLQWSHSVNWPWWYVGIPYAVQISFILLVLLVAFVVGVFRGVSEVVANH